MKTKNQTWTICLCLTVILFQFASCKKENAELITSANPEHEDAEVTALNSKLVAWYPFNGDVLDHSGNNNNVDFNNATPTVGKKGVSNTAYLFNGTSNYMTVPNSASLNPSSEITLVALFKPNGFYTGNGEQSRIFMKGIDDQSNGDYFLGFLNTGNAYGTYGDNQFESNGVGSGDNVIKLDKWYKLVYTYNGSVGRLYINGFLVNKVEKTATFTPNYSILRIGTTGRSDYPYWFNGVIDEIRIYNSALTPLQVLKVSYVLGR